MFPLWSVLDDVAFELERAGIIDARWEARRLLGHALDMDQTGLLRERDRLVDPDRVRLLLQRRLAREPLALILGRQDFWNLSLAVSPASLIPRADSETLIEAALAIFPARDIARVLDLGTGTGCLLLAALSEFPSAFGVGVDRREDAVWLAVRNAVANGLRERSAFICGDWAQSVAGRFDLVLCNPPYIQTGDIVGLMPEVASYEPISALDGGADGLAAYRLVINSMPSLLSDRGVAILELGIGQADSVNAMAVQSGLTPVGLRSDLGGIPRAMVLQGGVP